MGTIQQRKEECSRWTDERLTAELGTAAADERRALVGLLLHLAEFDKRRLSEKGAHSSLFDYCTRKLGYSSSEAGRRIAVARKGDIYPVLLEMIERKELHLSGAGMLAGLLTDQNHASILRAASGRTQDQIARLVAAVAPKPAPKDRIRVIRAADEAAPMSAPAPETGAAAGAATGPEGDADLFGEQAPPEAQHSEAEIYAISFAARRETRDMLERAKELLRHRFPAASTDEVVNLALKELLTKVDRDLRVPRASRPPRDAAERSRYIPEAVKQAAWERDGGRCAFVAADGARCVSKAWLEFDHVRPYALGGTPGDPSNIRLLCRAHNQLRAREPSAPGP